jgi:hypothetical protein
MGLGSCCSLHNVNVNQDMQRALRALGTQEVGRWVCDGAEQGCTGVG